MVRFRAFIRERNGRDRGRDGDGGGDAGQALGFVGHFAGIMLRADLVDRTEPGFGDAGPAAEISLVAQQDIERLLEESAPEAAVATPAVAVVAPASGPGAPEAKHTSAAKAKARIDYLLA